MLKIVVTYFLNSQGLEYFSEWYKEVYEITSQQVGFIKMHWENKQQHPIIYLYYASEEKLDAWASSELHNKLAAKIEKYFIKPQDVNITDLD